MWSSRIIIGTLFETGGYTISIQDIVGDLWKHKLSRVGEMNHTQLWETVLNPENRILERIPLRDAEIASQTIDLLMGKDVAPRRQFIEDNADTVDLELM